MLPIILQEIENTKIFINKNFIYYATFGLSDIKYLYWNQSDTIKKHYDKNELFTSMEDKIKSVETLIESYTHEAEFLDNWGKLRIRDQEKILFFSKNSYLSIRKVASLETINFPVFNNIEEFNDFGLQSLIDLTALLFDLELEADMDSVKEYKFKKIFEQKIEDDFPHFKAAKENTQQNLYKNIAWLGVMKIVNTKEQNIALTNFEINNSLPYSSILELDQYLTDNELYRPSSSLFFIDRQCFPQYFELEQKFKEEIEINSQRHLIDSSISLSANSINSGCANNKI